MFVFIQQLLLRYKFFFIASAICATALIISALIVYLNVAQLSSPIIFHFDKLNGIDVFGAKIDLWRFWLAGFMIILVNTILSHEFYYRERILSYILIGTNLLFSILTLIVVLLIVSIN